LELLFQAVFIDKIQRRRFVDAEHPNLTILGRPNNLFVVGILYQIPNTVPLQHLYGRVPRLYRHTKTPQVLDLGDAGNGMMKNRGTRIFA